MMAMASNLLICTLTSYKSNGKIHKLDDADRMITRFRLTSAFPVPVGLR